MIKVSNKKVSQQKSQVWRHHQSFSGFPVSHCKLILIKIAAAHNFQQRECGRQSTCILTNHPHLNRNIRQRSFRPLFEFNVNRCVKVARVISLCSGKINRFYEVRGYRWPEVFSDDVFPHLRRDLAQCQHFIQNFIASLVKKFILQKKPWLKIKFQNLWTQEKIWPAFPIYNED